MSKRACPGYAWRGTHWERLQNSTMINSRNFRRPLTSPANEWAPLDRGQFLASAYLSQYATSLIGASAFRVGASPNGRCKGEVKPGRPVDIPSCGTTINSHCSKE